MFDTLSKIGQKFNDEDVFWGVGASMLLNHYGLADKPNDIDLLVDTKDIGKADKILTEIGEKKPPGEDGIYATEFFYEYVVNGIEVDVISGFNIRHAQGLYRYVFDLESITQSADIDGIKIPLTALEDWYVIYQLLPNKAAKAKLIEEYLKTNGIKYPGLLDRALSGILPDEVRANIEKLLGAFSMNQKMKSNKAKPAPRKILGIEKNIFFIGLTSFFTDTATKMVYAIMPLFLMSLGASKTELSLIEGIAESTASVIKALSGWWSDKIRKNKPFMIIGYGITAVLSPVFALATTPLQVLMIRFTERVGKGIRTAPRDSMIAASSECGNRGRSFGFHKAMDNSGAIIGPLLAAGILLLYKSNYQMVFLIAIIPGILGMMSIIFFVKEAKAEKMKPIGRISLKDFPKKYYAFLGIAFIFTMGNSTDALLLVKASDVGIEAAFIPIVYMIFNSVSVLFSVPAGILSDKIGRERLIIFGYLLYSAVYFGFGRTSSSTAIVMLFALYGLYSAAADGAQKALVADLIPRDKRGTGLGIYNCLIGMTLLPASIIAGLLYDNINNSVPFYYGSAMAFVAAMLMIIFYRKNLAQPDKTMIE